jgi:uncharacterized protein YcbK (DUF882 family)
MRNTADSLIHMLKGLGAATVAVGLLVGTTAFAQPEENEPEVEGIEEAERPPGAPSEGEPGEIPGEGEEGEEEAILKPAKGEKATVKRRKGRKRVEGHVVHEQHLRRRVPPPPSGNLYLHRPIEGDSLKVNIFNPDGSYNERAIKAASHMLRCRRSSTEKPMEPRLLAILSHVFDHFGERRIDVVSGFRNQRKTSSYHYKGSASDIRVDGVSAKRLKEFVETLDSGGMGIGIYPITGFVHIDVRPPPSYRWIDYSKSNPDAEQKKPPPWVKRRRLQS